MKNFIDNLITLKKVVLTKFGILQWE